MKPQLSLRDGLLALAVVWGVMGAFVGFAAAAAVILVVAARTMGVPRRRAHSDEMAFSAWRLVGFMGAMVAYTLLLNIALNYDQPLLRRLAGAAVDPHAAGILAGHYDGLRTLALLPYQAQLHPAWLALLLVGGQCLPLALRRVAPVISLYVNEYNRPARAAYRRVGFTQTATFASVLF